MPSVVAYDFSNPFMAAAIVDSADKRYPLWTQMADGSAFSISTIDGNTLKALCFLTELVIELFIGDFPRITATLNPPLADAIMLFDSELVEFGDHRIEVVFGYAAGTADGSPMLSPTYEGLIIKPDFTIGTDCSITLHAVGTGSYSSGIQTSQETFSDTTRRTIVSTVFGRDGIEIDDDEVTNGPADVRALWADNKISKSQGNKTNWTFCSDLIRDSQCWLIQTDKLKVKIVPRNTIMTGKPVYTLALYQFQNGQVGGAVFPILSANTTSAAIFLPGIRSIYMNEIDPKTKKTTQSPIGDQQTAGSKATSGGVVDAASTFFPKADPKTNTGLNVYPGDPANQIAKDQATALYQNTLGDAMGIPLEIETMGMPNVIPGDIVSVQGLGFRLDRNYGVFKVTHTLGTNGFTTVLKLVSDTNTVVSKEIGVKPVGNTNTDAAPTDASDKVDVTAKG